MQTYEHDPRDFERSRQKELDKNLLVKFFYKPRPDRKATEKEGRPIFKDVLYIDIRVPGSRDTNVCRPATPADIQRFQDHHDAFMKRTAEPEQGTPLAEWPQITRSQVDELAFFNVKTVEHLAAMSDANAQQFMGINALKERARTWLEEAQGKNVEAEELRRQLAERDQRLAKLEAQVAELAQTGAAPKRKKAKARARPKARLNGADDARPADR